MYRSAHLTNAEWENLQNNIGKDIEMHGFLSTSKSFDAAFRFMNAGSPGKVFITIIIPGTTHKGQLGYAEIKEYSQFK